MLEMQADPEQTGQEADGELKATLEALLVQRDQLKARIKTNLTVRMLRDRMDNGSAREEEEEEEDLLDLTARRAQLKDLLRAHHLIGGYDVIQTRNGKGICVSLATAYEGVYLETYNLDMERSATLRINRHNIPPFIPVETLMKQSNARKEDMTAFLETLGRHLNAHAGRKQQLHLVKKLHTPVEVMESNAPCTVLVLMLNLPGDEPTAVLYTLEYGDRTACLPTQVNMDTVLPDSRQQEECRALFLETPVHTALLTMQTTGMIV